VLAALGASVSDADDAVRNAAIALLSTRRGGAAAETLIAQLGNRATEQRIVAALAQPVEGRVEAILGALVSARADRAPLLVSALARMQRPDATAAIERALGFDNVFARRAAAAALAASGTDAARALLRSVAANDRDEEVRDLGAASEVR
jgi:hypothetical protein